MFRMAMNPNYSPTDSGTPCQSRAEWRAGRVGLRWKWLHRVQPAVDISRTLQRLFQVTWKIQTCRSGFINTESAELSCLKTLQWNSRKFPSRQISHRWFGKQSNSNSNTSNILPRAVEVCLRSSRFVELLNESRSSGSSVATRRLRRFVGNSPRENYVCSRQSDGVRGQHTWKIVAAFQSGSETWTRTKSTFRSHRSIRGDQTDPEVSDRGLIGCQKNVIPFLRVPSGFDIWGPSMRRHLLVVFWDNRWDLGTFDLFWTCEIALVWNVVKGNLSRSIECCRFKLL